MFQTKKFVIRCRVVIINNNKLLVVRHPHDTSFAALPGGHLEWGEDVKECLSREIMEELGVKPEIGRLLYVNTFMDGETVQPIEFFFEVKNGNDYINSEKNIRSHAHELAEIYWASPADKINILPKKFADDFRNGTVLSDTVRYINELKQTTHGY